MRWRDKIYIDGCLPFGLHSAPKLFNILADLLCWIANQRGVSCILHYLDDFLIIGPPDSPACKKNLNTFIQLCDSLGIPLASEKIEGPSTSLSFLGIHLDTAAWKSGYLRTSFQESSKHLHTGNKKRQLLRGKFYH